MARSGAADIPVRVGMEGDELVSRDMRKLGEAGEEVGTKLKRAGKKGSGGLKLIDGAARDVNAKMQSMAGQLPVIGGGLSALGPVGVAAAAGVAGAAFAFKKMVDVGVEAVAMFADIQRQADTFGASTNVFQSLQFLEADQALDASKLDSALRGLAAGASQARAETGALYSGLKDSHPDLVAAISSTSSFDSQLGLVSIALEGAADQTERNQIAIAAFGESGLDVARALGEYEGGLQGVVDAAREAGLVIDADLIARSRDIQREFDLAARVTDLQLKEAFVDLAPVALAAAEGLADAASAMADFVDARRSLGNRTRDGVESTLEATIGHMRELIRLRDAYIDQDAPQSQINNLNEMIAGTVDRISALDMRLQELSRSSGDFDGRGVPGGPPTPPSSPPRPEVDPLDARAAQLFNQTRTAAENYHNALVDLGELYQTGHIDQELFHRGVEAATEIYEHNTPALALAARVREELTTETERLTSVQLLLNEAVELGGLTQEQAAIYMELLRDKTDDAAESSKQLQVQQTVLKEIIGGNIQSVEDLGQVFARILQKMVLDAIEAQTGIEQSLGGFLRSIAAVFFGGGGGAEPAADGGGSPTPQSHSGKSPGRGFSQLHAGRLRSHEMLTVVDDRERIFTDAENGALIGAINALAQRSIVIQGGGGGGIDGIDIKLTNEMAGTEARVDQKSSSQSRASFEIVFREMLRAEVGSGGITDILERMFGTQLRVGGG